MRSGSRRGAARCGTSAETPQSALSHQIDRHSAQIERKLETDLRAMQFEYHVIGIPQPCDLGAANDRDAGADRRVRAGDIGGTTQVPGEADEVGRSEADRAHADSA